MFFLLPNNKSSCGIYHHHHHHQGNEVTNCSGLTATYICENFQESEKYFKGLPEKAISVK
jgi:hypothetical protein